MSRGISSSQSIQSFIERETTMKMEWTDLNDDHFLHETISRTTDMEIHNTNRFNIPSPDLL